MTTTSTPPRRLGRSIGAILLSFVVVFVLSLGTDHFMHVLNIYPPYGESMHDNALLTLALSYRLVYGILGGYIVARFAPHSPMRHALISGGIGFVLSTAGAAAMWDKGDHWYPVALALSAVPCSWAGAAIFLKQVKQA